MEDNGTDQVARKMGEIFDSIDNYWDHSTLEASALPSAVGIHQPLLGPHPDPNEAAQRPLEELRSVLNTVSLYAVVLLAVALSSFFAIASRDVTSWSAGFALISDTFMFVFCLSIIVFRTALVLSYVNLKQLRFLQFFVFGAHASAVSTVISLLFWMSLPNVSFICIMIVLLFSVVAVTYIYYSGAVSLVAERPREDEVAKAPAVVAEEP